MSDTFTLRFIRTEPVHDYITRCVIGESKRRVKRTVKADTLRAAVVKAEKTLSKISTPDFQIRLTDAWVWSGEQWIKLENISDIPQWAKEQTA